MDIKPYKNKFEYSYTLGAFPTYELIFNRPSDVLEVYYSEGYTDLDKLQDLCKNAGIKLFRNDKAINRLSDKENIYVVGVYKKFNTKLDASKPHVMLVNPGNMGNVGTIIRTAIGFGIHDIAIIAPGVDIHNPKVVRGSMGAIFHMNIEYFDNFAEYESAFAKEDRKKYAFMLTATKQLNVSNCPKADLFTLIFGNEATGLPEEYAEYAEPIIIPQSDEVDSLNLTIAAGIGMYMFTNKN